MSAAAQVAIVTGSGSGIGRAAALLLARQGYAVAVASRGRAEAEQTVAEIIRTGGHAMALVTDVALQSDVDQMVQAVVTAWDRVDALVNNAGINIPAPIATVNPQDWAQVLAVDLTGPFLCARAVVPLMRRQGRGVIVNVGSPHAFRCGEGVAAYTAAKAALLGMTRALALDHAREGIRVNAVVPGTIDTPMVWNAYPRSEWEARRELISEVQPGGRLGQPEEVAAVIAFLVGPEAAFTSGGTYPVDGGLLASLF